MVSTMTTEKKAPQPSKETLEDRYEFGWMRQSGVPFVTALSRTFGGRLLSDYAVQEFYDTEDPVGIYLCITKIGSPIAYVASTVRGRHVIHVHDLLVAPAHRHKGIARRLLGSLLNQEISSDVRTVTFDVEETNTDLLLFLKHLGFRWLRTYKEPGGDVYLMSWTRPQKQKAVK